MIKMKDIEQEIKLRIIGSGLEVVYIKSDTKGDDLHVMVDASHMGIVTLRAFYVISNLGHKAIFYDFACDTLHRKEDSVGDEEIRKAEEKLLSTRPSKLYDEYVLGHLVKPKKVYNNREVAASVVRAFDIYGYDGKVDSAIWGQRGAFHVEITGTIKHKHLGEAIVSLIVSCNPVYEGNIETLAIDEEATAVLVRDAEFLPLDLYSYIITTCKTAVGRSKKALAPQFGVVPA